MEDPQNGWKNNMKKPIKINMDYLGINMEEKNNRFQLWLVATTAKE